MTQPQTHPLYTTWAPTWRLLRDVYEGAGGFLVATRPYLAAHPREYLDALVDGRVNLNPRQPSPKLTARRTLARYENLAAAVVDTLAGALFRQDPQRLVGDGQSEVVQPIDRFWENADGRGRDLSDVLRDAWIAAAVYGHAFLVLDRPSGREVRDVDSAIPYVRLYTPLDVVDWICNEDGDLTAIMVAEAPARTTFEQSAAVAQTQVVYRTIDATQWQVISQPTATREAQVEDAGPHGFGVLPVVVLYGATRPLTPVIGASLLGDPAIYIDHYNLLSEVRELLRNQTFGQLAVQVGPDADLIREHQAVTQGYGTTNAIVSSGTVSYVSPDSENVRVYHEHIDRVVRQIFRLARVPWEGDSKQTESGDSRSLKREDLNTTLAGYADELERVELALARLVYRGVYGATWEATWTADTVTVIYPDQFDPTPFEVLAQRFTTVMGMDPGETAVKTLKKRTVREALPDLTPSQLTAIDGEIEGQEILTKDEQRQQQLESAMTRLAAGQAMAGKATASAPKVDPNA
jgi:hypothetical protein